MDLLINQGLPGGPSGKESACQCRRCKRRRFDPWVGKIPWNRKWQPTPILLPGKFHRQRSLVGCSPWGYKVSDLTEATERAHTYTHTHTHTHTHTTTFPSWTPWAPPYHPGPVSVIPQPLALSPLACSLRFLTDALTQTVLLITF